jgi:hypothetical protein
MKPVEMMLGAATASGNSGDSFANAGSIRLPGNAAICSQRFLTIGRMRAGPSRQQD